MKLDRGRRIAALAVAGILALGALVTVASADSSLEALLRSKQDLRGRIEKLHELRRVRRIAIHQRIKFHQNRIHQQIKFRQNRLQHSAGRGGVGNGQGYGEWRKRQIKVIKKLRKLEHQLLVSLEKRVDALRERRAEIADWIANLPLQVCPVDGPHVVSDNFGDVRDMPGTPWHIHQGNDISAATGTPIVAPFAGTAVAEPNYLGGQAVKVYGADGYVYNAHLSAYGMLGEVQTGDIIGYVGSTGNATAPHNHFEWHPGDGEAIDPYEDLMRVC